MINKYQIANKYCVPIPAKNVGYEYIELPNWSDLGLVELMNLFLAIPRKLTYLTVTEMKL